MTVIDNQWEVQTSFTALTKIFRDVAPCSATTNFQLWMVKFGETVKEELSLCSSGRAVN
jgi:hypothetical protein